MLKQNHEKEYSKLKRKFIGRNRKVEQGSYKNSRKFKFAN